MVESQDHQGFVAWVQAFAYQKKFFEPAKAPFIVLLDGVQDPRNLGAIIRSMHCMGVSGVVLVKKGASPLTPAAIKASAGLAEYMQIFVASSTGEALLLVKNAGYALYIATFGGKDVTQVEFAKPLCLVIGSEGAGVSHGIAKEGIKITVPQVSEDVSYNASVAASLIAFVITQKIKKA
jgi:23S rRNA (guanosine2251-2'-O)-methyltransferase